MFKSFTIPQSFTLKTTSRGKVPVFTMANVAPLIDANYQCTYNKWSNEEFINGNKVTDNAVAHIRGDIEKSFERYHVPVSTELVSSALSVACHEHEFDPLLERLEAAEKLWHDKGEPKNLLKMFVDYLGCEDTEFTEKVTQMFTYGLIARAFNPGTKYDTFIVFSGEQGLGKSTFLGKLGGAFFNDTLDFSMFGTELALERLYKGIWLAEIQEMKQISKTDENTLKAFITTQVDDYRPKYEKHVEAMPRRTVFVGTTNNSSDLFQDKDNRRFVILECSAERQKKSVFTMTEETVELIIGEMVALYREGIDYKRLDEEIREQQREINSNYVCRDDNLSDLETFLRMPRPADWETRDKTSKFAHYTEYVKNPDNDHEMVECISTNEIWCEMMGMHDHTMDMRTTKSIARELQILGYTKKRQGNLPGYGRIRMYCRNKTAGTTPPKDTTPPAGDGSLPFSEDTGELPFEV